MSPDSIVAQKGRIIEPHCIVNDDVIPCRLIVLKPNRSSIYKESRIIVADTIATFKEDLQLDSALTDSGNCFAFERDHIKCFPSFVIAGTMKSGTGELMKWLNLHPQLSSGKGLSGENEMHFFTKIYHHDLSSFETLNSSTGHAMLNRYWQTYLRLFPSFSLEESKFQYTFDKSPDYIRCPAALFRLKTLLPSVKIIILLRDPTMRLLSGFQHNCRHRRYARLKESTLVTIAESHDDKINKTCNEKIFVGTSGQNMNANYNEREKRTETSTKNVVISATKVIKIDNFQSFVDVRYDMCSYPCTSSDFMSYIFANESENYSISGMFVNHHSRITVIVTVTITVNVTVHVILCSSSF